MRLFQTNCNEHKMSFNGSGAANDGAPGRAVKNLAEGLQTEVVGYKLSLDREVKNENSV